ncbi:hypothetical protein D3C78_17570 [compost metagenome]
MNKKKLGVIVISSLIAVVATLILFTLSKGSEEEYVDIVVLNKILLRGEQFTSAQLDPMSIPKAKLSNSMIVNADDLVGKYAIRDIDPTSPIQKTWVGDSVSVRSVSEGMVPIRIPVTEQSQGGAIPGDRVNILMTTQAAVQAGQLVKAASTETIANNVRVINLLYNEGAELTEKQVAEANSEGQTASATGATGDAAINKLDPGKTEFPILVTVEVDPAIARYIIDGIANKNAFSLEVDPWQYDKVSTLKEAITKEMDTLIKFSGGTLVDFKKAYSRLTSMENEFLKANGGGAGYEKEFYRTLVRTKIDVVKKVTTADQTSKDFVAAELNALAQDLSDLHNGWWTIQDEIDSIQKTIEGLGKNLTIEGWDIPKGDVVVEQTD